MTISKKCIRNYWDGKFKVYEISDFEDSRGLVCETFRCDDDITGESKMCYVSETKPYVLRGPHQHSNQTDNFVSWKTKMVYHMYNPETKEMNYFVTDPNKFYLVVVAPPIIHSYRNISDKVSMTMNFPTSLFKGEGKKEQIDEIRWEHKLNKGDVFVILGAKGRLGKSLTQYLFDNMEFHQWDVIPVESKFNSDEDINQTFSDIQNSIDNAENRNIYVINCAASTNVGSDDVNAFNFINTEMPVVAAKDAQRRKWTLIQISSD